MDCCRMRTVSCRIKGKPNHREGHILREDRIEQITCLLTGATTLTDELFHIKARSTMP